MLVFADQLEESIDRTHFGHRIVLVPFQIRSSPIDKPSVPRLQVSSFRHRLLTFLSGVVPPGPDLEDFDTPAVEAKVEIDLATKVSRRPMLRNERRNGILDTLPFYVVHVCYVR